MATTLDNYFAAGWRDQPTPVPPANGKASRAMVMELDEDATEYVVLGVREPLLLVVLHPSLARGAGRAPQAAIPRR